MVVLSNVPFGWVRNELRKKNRDIKRAGCLAFKSVKLLSGGIESAGILRAGLTGQPLHKIGRGVHVELFHRLSVNLWVCGSDVVEFLACGTVGWMQMLQPIK